MERPLLVLAGLSLALGIARGGMVRAQERPPVLGGITVTATRLPAPVLEVAQSVSVIHEAEIAEHNVRTTPEALQEEVGILVQETNLGGGSPFIRGQTGNRILVLIDGVRFNNSTFRFGPNQYLNTVDAQQIERLEVVRGPASVLYGSDALGGVINVITKRRAQFERPFDIDARLRTQFSSAAFEKTVRLDGGWNRGALGFQGGITARDFDDLRAGSPTGVQEHTGYSELDGDARLQYRLAPDHELAFSFQRVTQSRVPNTVAFTLDSESFFFDPQRRTLYALEHELASLPLGFQHWRTSVSFHDQREVRQRQRFASSVQRREEDEVGTVGVTSQLERPIFDAHRLTTGVEVYHDRVDSTRVDTDTTTSQRTVQRGAFPDNSEYETLGVFVQTEIQLGAALHGVTRAEIPLSLVLGGRYSRFAIDSEPSGFGRLQRSFDDFTGSVAASYLLHDGWMLVASAAQGFRAPNLDDTVVLRAVPEQGGVDTPNPTLGPERVDNYEGGLKVELPAISGSLFYFYSDYSALIERRRIGFDDTNMNGLQDGDEATIFQRQNIGAAVVQGVESEAVVRLRDGLDVRGTFAWTRGENTTAREPFSRIPPAMGLAGLRYRHPRLPFWIEYFARVAGQQSRLSARDTADRRIPPGGAPGWHTHNLRGGWTPFRPLQITLAIENLADEQYRLHGSGIEAPGINVIGSATWRF